MRALLDTCALSELTRSPPNPGVVRAVDSLGNDSLFLSVLSLGEIAKGIELLDQGRRRNQLVLWLASLEKHYADRILGVDPEIAQIWGELSAAAQQRGRTVGAIDGLIAATARRHGLHVMTRNEADFEPTGALILNPWV